MAYLGAVLVISGVVYSFVRIVVLVHRNVEMVLRSLFGM
jgi:hypothetical protein